MGQGLNTKVAQVVADALQVDFDRIKITRTTTEKVPNTSATAASSRLRPERHGGAGRGEQIKAAAGRISPPNAGRPSREQVQFRRQCASRSATRRCPSPTSSARPTWRASSCRQRDSTRRPRSIGTGTQAQGRPFYYYAYGAACSEVSIDTLTGEYRVERTDILHDVGRSLNPALDKGQVEGAFIQGMGWLTTEELWWDEQGQLRTHAPSTYKIPLASDRPRIFNVNLADWSENREQTIKRSKAVGEPPFMLGISVFEALSHGRREHGGLHGLARGSTPPRRPSGC